jgi:hypothetical protein
MRSSRKVVAVDFDNTLCSDTAFGKPDYAVTALVGTLLSRGHFVVVYTARPWEDHQAIQMWLHEHGLWVDAVICGKLRFDVLIDDRVINTSVVNASEAISCDDVVTRIEGM